MPYEFLEDVATADVAFRAWGTDLEEAFTAAADALMNVMVEEIEAIEPRETRQLTAEQEALDMLLFDLLQELVYYKDAEQLMLRVREVRIEQRDGRYHLSATAQGEHLDPHRHHPGVDVKAVTLHRFKLEHSAHGWEAAVILDI